ncbi:MAG TPA: hypothetical protein VKK79_04970 [Candidatus Lokiarchaeia archaeon]|nr:hypothetical protein [Candidatus Lokiarchaeia archaeon]
MNLDHSEWMETWQKRGLNNISFTKSAIKYLPEGGYYKAHTYL